MAAAFLAAALAAAAESAAFAAEIFAFAKACAAFLGGGEKAKKLCFTGVPRAVVTPAAGCFEGVALAGLAVCGTRAGAGALLVWFVRVVCARVCLWL